MAKHEIFVPRLDWLIGGSRIGSDYNTYYGSTGTDPLLGCFNRQIFNYTVRMKKLKDENDEEREIIEAGVYTGVRSIETLSDGELTLSQYPAEEKSLPLIKSWLEEKADEILG